MRPGLFAPALALAAATSPNEWHPCPLYSDVGTAAEHKQYEASYNFTAECIELSAPVCYPGVCEGSKTLTLFLKRIPATHPTTPAKAVWLMQGGPGAASDAMEPSMAQIYEAANGTISLYTMDHRGVGRSSPLSAICPDVATAEIETLDVAHTKCFKKLKAKYGPNAAKGFSVTSAATDLATIIQSPLLAASDVFVYGVSYGTYLTERLMHLAPKNVKGYILDSMLAESPLSTYSDWDRDVAHVEKEYYHFCDKDPVCASKIGPNSKQFAFDLYKKLDANDTACAQTIYAAKGIPSDFVGSTLAGMLTNYNQRNLIPAILYRLAKCVVDVESEATFLTGLLGLASEADDTEGRDDIVPGDAETGESVIDDILYSNIVFNEIWESPSPSVERLEKDSSKLTWRSSDKISTLLKVGKYCLYTGGKDAVCKQFEIAAGSESFAYAHDQYWNKTAAVPAGASALLLSGGIDVQTIPKYAVAQNASMAGDKKLLLQFPFGGHSIISTTSTDPKDATKHCGMDILNMYLQSGGNLKAIKTDCMENVQPLDFTLIHDEAKALELFGNTTDLFGDEERRVRAAVQSEIAKADAKHSTETIALTGGLIACVLAVMGMALYVKKQQRALAKDSTAAVESEVKDAKEDNAKEESASDDATVAQV
ncbi:hypothetical protein SPRG_11327 [Saprolegnia parasitica CBS 223.65]|uniref:AB hydrolase-1 domain-containing protein n=1 Tax=Saprolegnia parasitica (strain CBS 223.65) TaxID=695850 RepID=A0A067BZU2_SAPPC|nr:hypothetical protein SPRG_11327 [Saprolegnia parasitica CBS 223.65]KDO22375.1 hypothetical protein SPRG_11327 [Saprolegnia parasitica CBS 223.65]|eukprot:XP_012206899.1 hypothetical protein SPRG_11327 [Saprolegnia parasitica CBS 223.65]